MKNPVAKYLNKFNKPKTHIDKKKESKKPYVDGVSLEDILLDGWSRGFDVQQTIDEAHAMGHYISEPTVRFVWAEYDKNYEENSK